MDDEQKKERSSKNFACAFKMEVQVMTFKNGHGMGQFEHFLKNPGSGHEIQDSEIYKVSKLKNQIYNNKVPKN